MYLLATNRIPSYTFWLVTHAVFVVFVIFDYVHPVVIQNNAENSNESRITFHANKLLLHREP